MKKALLALTLTSGLCACGGGGGDAQPLAEQNASSVGPWRCVDFVWVDDAQRWYDRHRGARPDLSPEYTLDKNDDGLVDCPALPNNPNDTYR